MRLRKIWEHIWETTERHGPSSALADVVIKAINRVVFCVILHGISISAADAAYLEENEKYRYGFLDRRVLMTYAGQKEYELSEAFVTKAFDEGDECFGILDGSVLASYGWYSSKPGVISDGLELHFDSHYIYMYMGFTHPHYRGQRLHAVGMTMALREYLNRGYKGLVSYVESNNFNSLKSVSRMGYHDFGKVYVVRILGKYLAYSTRGCRAYGFRVETTKHADPRPVLDGGARC